MIEIRFPSQLRDLNIIPVNPDSKIPAIKWYEYQKKKYDKPLPDLTNYAVICGKISNNLVVIDFDDRQLYDKFFSDIETFTVETPNNGIHVYFYSDQPVKKIPKYKGYPIDVQGEGSLIIIPPSKIGLKEYRVIKDVEIKQADILKLLNERLPKTEGRTVSDDLKQVIGEIKRRVNLPEYVERYVKKEYQGKGYWQGICPLHPDTRPSFTVYEESYHCYGCGKHGDTISFVQEFHGLEFKEAIKKLCEEFNIDYKLKRSFEKSRHVKVDKIDLAKRINYLRDVKDVKDVKVDIFFKSASESTNKISKNLDNVDNVDISSENTYLDQQTTENLDMVVDFDVSYFFDKDKFNAKRLADLIMSKYVFITIMDNEEVWFYENGVFRPNGEIIIKLLCQKYLGEEATRHRIEEVIGHIQRSTYIERSAFDSNINLLAVENGVLNLETMELLPHSPEYLLTVKIPVKYDHKADCSNIKKFFSEVLHPDDIPVIEEFFGYCLYCKYPIHKAFMLIGSGRNGKSTLLNLLRIFLGSSNVSNIPLQAFESSRFAIAELYGKLANFYADISSKALRDTGLFKSLTGEDSITADRKFKKAFKFINYAKLIYSCNKLPESEDDTDAFFARWIIINFPNKFEGEKADKKLIDKLTTPEELSGLLNLALAGLKRLLDKGEFSKGISTEETREQYIRMSDSVGSFVMDCVEIAPDDWVAKDEFYNAYCEYCRDNKLPVVPKNKISEKLQKHVRVEDYRPTIKINGKRPTAWKGIRFVEDNENGNNQSLTNFKGEDTEEKQFEEIEFSSEYSYSNTQDHEEESNKNSSKPINFEILKDTGICELCGENGANAKVIFEDGSKLICHLTCAFDEYPELKEMLRP